MEKSYEEKKEKARQEAIEWQNTFAERNLSYGEIQAAYGRFLRLAKRYGLTREFQENGIL